MNTEENGRTISDFELLLLFKNQLVFCDVDELKKIYSEIEDYSIFVDNVALMLNEEPAFLLLSKDFRKKIDVILETRRFTIDDDIISQEINEIALCLNELESIDDDTKNQRISNYKAYHENIRNEEYATIADFGITLANDCPTYYYLKGELDDRVKSSFEISSIIYFLETVPEMFNDPMVLKRLEFVLKDIAKDGSIFNPSKKRLAKDAKMLLKTIF